MARVVLDDRDPIIIYSAGWHTGGLSTSYNATTMYTLRNGTTATLTFQGTSITVYGTIASNDSNKTAPQSQYQVDGYEPAFYQATLTSEFQLNEKFYQSPQLPKAQHTLVVTNLLNGSSSLILDYFVILNENATSSSSSSISPAGGTRQTSIIAGSVGGVVGCLLLIIGIIYFWRRRERNLHGLVQNAWADESSPVINKPPEIPHSRPSKFTSSTIPLSPRMTLPVSESTHASDVPPPEYSLSPDQISGTSSVKREA